MEFGFYPDWMRFIAKKCKLYKGARILHKHDEQTGDKTSQIDASSAQKRLIPNAKAQKSFGL